MDIKHKLTNRILLTIPANTMVRADLTDACLVGANMKDANMEDVTMVRADLTDACLVGANMEDANMEDVTMVRADLTDACLVGANMKDANMEDVTMEDVINKFPPNK